MPSSTGCCKNAHRIELAGESLRKRKAAEPAA